MLSQNASDILSSTRMYNAIISQLDTKEASNNDTVSKSLNINVHTPKTTNITHEIKTKSQQQPNTSNNKQKASSKASPQINLKLPAEQEVKVSTATTTTQHVTQTVQDKQSPVSLKPKPRGSQVVQKESQSTFQSLPVANLTKIKPDTSKQIAQVGALGSSRNESQSKITTNKTAKANVSDLMQNKTETKTKTMESEFTEDISGEGADLLKSTSRIEINGDEDNLPGATGDDITEEDLQKLQSISVTTGDTGASSETDFGDLMSSLSTKPNNKETKKSETGSIPTKKDDKPLDNKKIKTVTKSADAKIKAVTKSENVKIKAVTKSADAKIKAVTKSADAKIKAVTKSVDANKTETNNKSVNHTKTKSDHKLVDDKKTEANNKSAADKKTTIPALTKEVSKTKLVNASEFSFDKSKKSTTEPSKPLKAWTMIFNDTDENLPGGYGDDYLELEKGSGGDTKPTGSGKSKEDIEIQVESSIGQSYETNLYKGRGSGSGEDYSGNEVLPGDYGSETPLNLEEETGSGGEDSSGLDFMSGTDSGSGSGLDLNINEYLKDQAGYPFSKSKTKESKEEATTQKASPKSNKQPKLNDKAQSETVSPSQNDKESDVPVSKLAKTTQATVKPIEGPDKTAVSKQEPKKLPEIQQKVETKQEESEIQPKKEAAKISKPETKQGESEMQSKSEAKQVESDNQSKLEAKQEESEIQTKAKAKQEESEIQTKPVAKQEESKIQTKPEAKQEESEIQSKTEAKQEGSEIQSKSDAKHEESEIQSKSETKQEEPEIQSKPEAKHEESETRSKPEAKQEESDNQGKMEDKHKEPEFQPKLEGKPDESEFQSKVVTNQDNLEESSGDLDDLTGSGSGGESGSGEKFDVNLHSFEPHEETQNDVSEGSASGSGFSVIHTVGSKDFYPSNIGLNPAVGIDQFKSQQQQPHLAPALPLASIPVVNAIPRHFHSNLTVQINQVPSMWTGKQIEKSTPDYTSSISESGEEAEEESGSSSGDEEKQVKEIAKDQTAPKEDKTISEEEENTQKQTTQDEEPAIAEATKTKEQSYDEAELPHQREIIKTPPIAGTKKHHKPAVVKAAKHEELMPQDDEDDEEEDAKPKYEGFTDPKVWPGEGDIVTEEFLEHIMVSQLLEQNLKLFYTNMAGRPGAAGSAGEKGVAGGEGAPGQSGATGFPGEPGAIGPAGSSGIKGPAGTTGWPGLKGEMGGAGEPGLQGPKGSRGPPGPSGLSGILGDEPVLPNCSYVCEGEKAWLQCKQYEVIKILRVYWGREDAQICTKSPQGLNIDKTCESDPDNAFRKVDAQCKFQQGCEIVASNIFFDDNTCGDVFKYLKICYECTPDEANAVDVLLEKKRRRRRRRKREGEKFEEPERRKRSLTDNFKKRYYSNNVHISKHLWRHPFHHSAG